jgi:50S ribosomal protein L16 3-hydroxylase
MTRKFASGLDAAKFFRRHWQQRPLLARGALPQYRKLLTRQELFRLAARDTLQSRLVMRRRNGWHVEHGPFTRRRLERLPQRGWTLLVQGVDQALPRARELLLTFNFIPYARLDDVMVSYAPPGGGVGPHYDSYDVFLLQIAGTRRWRLSSQRDLALIPDAPLKLLADFRAERECSLEPGDMLYLPPRIAHDGIAVDDCLTASIGFRTPSAQELGVRFLEFLQDGLALQGDYRDPGLRIQHHPAQIHEDMLRKVRRMLARIDWTSDDVTEFLGRYLTEPKAHVVFSPPRRPLAPSAFAARAARQGVHLDLKTQLLFHGRRFFVNGESCMARREELALLTRLADRRGLPASLVTGGGTAQRLYQWYRAGYIGFGPTPAAS